MSKAIGRAACSKSGTFQAARFPPLGCQSRGVFYATGGMVCPPTVTMWPHTFADYAGATWRGEFSEYVAALADDKLAGIGSCQACRPDELMKMRRRRSMNRVMSLAMAAFLTAGITSAYAEGNGNFG